MLKCHFEVLRALKGLGLIRGLELSTKILTACAWLIHEHAAGEVGNCSGHRGSVIRGEEGCRIRKPRRAWAFA